MGISQLSILTDLFDYQKFANHKKLGGLIDETNQRYGLSSGILGIKLPDNDLMINAAGESSIPEEDPLKNA